MDGNPDEKNKSSLFLASQVGNLPPNMSGAALWRSDTVALPHPQPSDHADGP